MTPPTIDRVAVRALSVPTDAPEADGTLEWAATGLAIVEIHAGGETGLGWSYAPRAAAAVVEDTLAPLLRGGGAFDLPGLHARMVRALRNLGRRGVGAHALSACDVALWDLKARLLGLPLAALFGQARETVEIYGSGGFTSYGDDRLRDQLAGWVAREGVRRAKIKVGTEPERDPARMTAAKAALGDATLMIDANGAFSATAALALAAPAAALGVDWYEEPVSSDDVAGLAQVRARAPAGMAVAAGEYGYEPTHFRRLLEGGAVDALQADATRCGGYTGFLRAAALAEANNAPLSAHTAPSLHLPVCLAAPNIAHIEWFHDHVRTERMLFDGAPEPRGGVIAADPSRPGHGLALKRADAERFAA